MERVEAAEMGLAAVATRVSGCIDAFEDGLTGALVSAQDAAAMTQAIERYMTIRFCGRSTDRPAGPECNVSFDRMIWWLPYGRNMIGSELPNSLSHCCKDRDEPTDDGRFDLEGMTNAKS